MEFCYPQKIDWSPITKIHEGRPNIVNSITNGEIHLVVNTPSGNLSAVDDSYIRKTAIKYKLPYITTTVAAIAAVKPGSQPQGQKHSEVLRWHILTRLFLAEIKPHIEYAKKDSKYEY